MTLTVDGQAYTFRPLGVNALCAMEATVGKPFGAILVELGVMGLEGIRLSTVRVFLQLAVETPLTEMEVGRLIDALGFDGISKAINGLIWPAREVS